MASEQCFWGGVRIGFLAVVSVFVLATSAAHAADRPRRPVEKIIPDALLDECLKQGKEYAASSASG